MSIVTLISGILSPFLFTPKTPEASPSGLATASVDGLVTAALIEAVAPGVDAACWVAPLTKACNAYGITTTKCLAAFVAQIAYESGWFKDLEEDLNYSAQTLLRVFPNYFTPAQANAYAHNAERIANRAYANRMGNGDEASGDGWAYRGRGLIMITGKDQFQSLADALDMSLAETVTYVGTQEGAAVSAGWFWHAHGLNVLAEADQFTLITMRINGGTNGLAERSRAWAQAQAVLNA